MIRLIRNIYINISAFSINTAIGLAAISIIIDAYGLEGYGILVLARQLLPIGIVGFFLAGLPEATSRYVASSIAEANAHIAESMVKIALLCAIAIGIVVLVLISTLASSIVTTFAIQEKDIESFKLIIYLTAISLPLHFAGDILRGALEGLGRFGVVRTVEVFGNLVFLVTVIVMPALDFGMTEVIISFVIIGNARSILYFFLAGSKFHFSLSIGKAEFSDAKPLLQHAMAFFTSKLYGAALNHAPTVIVTYLTSNTLSAGALDVVMKIPRLIKTGCGMFGNVLLPYSAKADALGNDLSISRVIRSGTMALVAMTTPLIFIIGIFNKELINNWIGAEYIDIEIWFAYALFYPVLISTVSIGNAMLAARRSAVARLNRIAFFQVLVFYFSVAALNGAFGWKAFIIATLVATLVSVVLQHLIIKREYNIIYKDYYRYLFRGLSVFAMILCMKILLVSIFNSESVVSSLVIFLLCTFAMYFAVYSIVLRFEDRLVLNNLMTQIPLLKRRNG
jgi:O-antigen/teichoic acid export membrane protein